MGKKKKNRDAAALHLHLPLSPRECPLPNSFPAVIFAQPTVFFVTKRDHIPSLSQMAGLKFIDTASLSPFTVLPDSLASVSSPRHEHDFTWPSVRTFTASNGVSNLQWHFNETVHYFTVKLLLILSPSKIGVDLPFIFCTNSCLFLRMPRGRSLITDSNQRSRNFLFLFDKYLVRFVWLHMNVIERLPKTRPKHG